MNAQKKPFSSLRSSLLCSLSLLGAGLAPGETMASVLLNASYHARVCHNNCGNPDDVDSGSVPVPAVAEIDWSETFTSISGESRTDTWVASAIASGGQKPQAQIDGEGGGFGSGRAEAGVNYYFKVVAAGNSTRTAVPVLVTPSAEVSVGGDFNYARAFVQISFGVLGQPNFYKEIIASAGGSEENPSDSFTETVSAVLPVDGLGSRVILYVEGRGWKGGFKAVADPIIVIDPNATFFDNGTEYFYKDYFSLEYSPTIEQYVAPVPLPLSGLLFGSGLLSMFGFSRCRDKLNAPSTVFQCEVA